MHGLLSWRMLLNPAKNTLKKQLGSVGKNVYKVVAKVEMRGTPFCNQALL